MFVLAVFILGFVAGAVAATIIEKWDSSETLTEEETKRIQTALKFMHNSRSGGYDGRTIPHKPGRSKADKE